MTAILIDIALLLIVWLFGVRGASKGGVKTIYGLLSFCGAAVLTLFCYKPVYAYFMEYPAFQSWMAQTETALAARLSAGSAEGAPLWMTPFLNTASDSLSMQAANVLMGALSVLLVYLFIKVLLFVLIRVIDAVFHLPLLNTLNKGVGFCCGVLRGLLFLWVLAAVFALCASAPWFADAERAVQETVIAKFFYLHHFTKGLLQLSFFS